MLPPAPGLLSTMMLCPSWVPSSGARIRTRMSLADPGV
ncbi:Uncharacterised protein [Bordetella pertussis]|nr:Uncharacterised protein [Bordetella pertussis]